MYGTRTPMSQSPNATGRTPLQSRTSQGQRPTLPSQNANPYGNHPVMADMMGRGFTPDQGQRVMNWVTGMPQYNGADVNNFHGVNVNTDTGKATIRYFDPAQNAYSDSIGVSVPFEIMDMYLSPEARVLRARDYAKNLISGGNMDQARAIAQTGYLNNSPLSQDSVGGITAYLSEVDAASRRNEAVNQQNEMMQALAASQNQDPRMAQMEEELANLRNMNAILQALANRSPSDQESPYNY